MMVTTNTTIDWNLVNNLTMKTKSIVKSKQININDAFYTAIKLLDIDITKNREEFLLTRKKISKVI